MGAIDIHVHAFPDKLAKRAISSLQANCPWQAIGYGTITALMDSMDAADIDVSVVNTIATSPDQVKGIFNWCNKIRSERIEPFPSVHPLTPRGGKWMAKFAEAGFVGIKIHPMYQDFCFDDPRMDPIFAAACEHDMIVAAHCGRDIAFPPDDDRASPDRICRVVGRYPQMKLVCTHMGGWRMWDDVERCLLGTNVYLETSFSLTELDAGRAKEMIHRHGHQRVMLGSDWPWVKQAEAIQQVKQLGLDEKATSAVLWANAARLLGY